LSERLEEQDDIKKWQEILKDLASIQNCIIEAQNTEDVSEERKKAAAARLKKYIWLRNIAAFLSDSKKRIKLFLQKMETKDFMDTFKEAKAFLSKLAKVITEVSSVIDIPTLKILLGISQKLIPIIEKFLENPETAIMVLKILLGVILKILDELEKFIWKIIENEPEDSKIFKKILEAANHPALQGLAAFGSGGAFAFLAANIALPAVGFGANGIIGGSIAATIMSASGPIASGSAFAVLQSIGVVGLGVVTGGAVVAVGGAIGLGGFGIYKLVKFIKEKDKNEQ